MTSDAISRVRYFSNQFLRTPDFTDEQRYHLDMRRRHNIGHHTFGIVAGLELQLQDDLPVVEPGMAVDGYGRELVLAQRTPLAVPRAFVARATDRLEVWLAYNLVSTDEAPEGYASCVTGIDTSYRQVELPIVRYTVPDPDETDRRAPATVPDGDVGFGPARRPPDSPIDDWPVYLGSVTRTVEDGQETYTIDTDGRAYAGLVGEEIRAPSGRASVQVGAERDDDPFRFAVRVAGVAAPELPRFAVLREGGVAVVGQTALLGNVSVGGVVEIEAGPAVPDLTGVAAEPWTLSHHADTNGRHELRLQMDGPLGSTDHEVAVGTFKEVTKPDGSKAEEFSPCLTVSADCKVTVHGDLIVEGQLTAPDVKAAQLTTTAYSVVNAAFLSGVAGASNLIDTFYKSPFAIAKADIDFSTPVLSGPPGDDPAVVAADLAADPAWLEEVAAALRRRHPDAARRFQVALDERA